MRSTLPAQPPEEKWTFIEDLKQPLHQNIAWRKRAALKGEVSLAKGVRLVVQFPDPRELLATAYEDFGLFLEKARLSLSGSYAISVRQKRTLATEEYFIEIGQAGCEVLAGDTEGIRRAVIWLEDEMLRRGGPFLPLGKVHRKPVIRTRLSRCFYGPIKRPPKNRDELTDEVDYYPDEYLNRLAHEGVNGLWLTITFRDLCRSKIFSEYGMDARRRLDKLRSTVSRCERYGIKIYPFCIEPAAFRLDDPILAAHPDLKGHVTSGMAAFCTSTEKGQAYLEEAVKTLFTAVPGLGGLICIPVGERFTHCHSVAIEGSRWGKANNCPRCSKRKPEEVLHDTLAAMRRGMSAVNPSAELIAWPYSQYSCWGKEMTEKAAGKLPRGVILQHNFESTGRNRQLGKWREAEDYWLSYIGPSELFAKCARRATRNGNRMFAKLQVGCSHEVATAPHVPVPGNLYKKYKAMHRLKVSGAMQCWYFGNYPSLMTRAAGELSFAPLPATENGFLLKMARRDWGRNAAKVVKAWRFFQAAYDNYPTAAMMGYYGPMHDGPVWPLHLEPVLQGLSPTWQINYPPSGDQVGECFGGFAYKEILALCGKMAREWRKGAAIMRSLREQHRGDRERLSDINVAEALGLQFESADNIFRFYDLREKLAVASGAKRLELLEKMRFIAEDELRIDCDLLLLSASDPRLGFHSEAEGYKYFPEKIRWRMKELEQLLKIDFPRIRARILKDDGPVFPAYTGEKPEGGAYRPLIVSNFPASPEKASAIWENVAEVECAYWGKRINDVILENDNGLQLDRRMTWKAIHTCDAIYVKVRCQKSSPKTVPPTEVGPYWDFDSICLHIKTDGISPHHVFAATAHGLQQHFVEARMIVNPGWTATTSIDGGNWTMLIKIPFKTIGFNDQEKPKALRFNILQLCSLPESNAFCSWGRPEPLPYRLALGSVNPAKDFGWLVF